MLLFKKKRRRAMPHAIPWWTASVAQGTILPYFNLCLGVSLEGNHVLTRPTQCWIPVVYLLLLCDSFFIWMKKNSLFRSHLWDWQWYAHIFILPGIYKAHNWWSRFLLSLWLIIHTYVPYPAPPIPRLNISGNVGVKSFPKIKTQCSIH
jgi:hypothetical protein